MTRPGELRVFCPRAVESSPPRLFHEDRRHRFSKKNCNDDEDDDDDDDDDDYDDYDDYDDDAV